jgi:hypothetical protein
VDRFVPLDEAAAPLKYGAEDSGDLVGAANALAGAGQGGVEEGAGRVGVREFTEVAGFDGRAQPVGDHPRTLSGGASERPH